MTAQIGEMRALVAAYAGAEDWWADVFVQFHWDVEAARLFLDTSARTEGSLLMRNVEKALADELKAYTGPRGLLADAGANVRPELGKVAYTVRAPLVFEEREALLREVGSVATLKFVPCASRAYIDHGVATSANAVTWRWLMSLTDGRMTAEVGPKLGAILPTGVDVGKYIGYAPNLGPRDVVRHDVSMLMKRISQGRGRFSEMARTTVEAYQRGTLVKTCRIEDDDTPAEVIVSNHADYDIDLDAVPSIMDKHGARVWYGVIMRPRGLCSGTDVTEGEVEALGARYVINKAADEISFHFRGKGTFAYHHKFSSYVKREERNDYRWRGRHYDYVYSKMPMSTDATLYYVIHRVKKAGNGFSEPVYAPSGMKGMVEIQSIRVYSVAGRWRVSPITFSVERLAIEKVLENRRAYGTKGNISHVMSYLASVRVRFFLNGVYVGAEHPLSVDLFTAAAVFVEAYVTMTRMGDEYDSEQLAKAYDEAVAERGFFAQVGHWLNQAAVRSVGGPVTTVRRWREAVEKMVSSVRDFKFSMRPCPDVVQVSSGVADGVVEDSLGATGCACAELKEVRAALSTTGLYSDVEMRDLREYCVRLEEAEERCECKWKEEVVNEGEAGYPSESSSTCVEEDEDDEKEEFFEARSVDRRAAMVEYSELMMHNKRALDSDSVREAALLFRDGVPEETDLMKAKTARVTPAAVLVRNGRLIRTRGAVEVADVGALVDVTRYVVVPTQCAGRGRRVDVRGVSDGWHYTSSALKVYNGEELSRTVGALSKDDGLVERVRALDIRFVRGPFGAGKTRLIVDMLKGDIAKGLSVMYLSATLSSVEEVVKALAARGVSNARCATFDSYVMNRSWRAQRVYVDEGPMVHHGEMLAALGKAEAMEVLVFGDFNQIPFCSFTAEFDTPLASMEEDVRVVKRMNVLHRCRKAVLAMWDHLYDGELVPCDCCPHVREDGDFLEVKRIGGVGDVPVDEKLRYMVFTQREKELLRERVGAGASIEVLKKKRVGGLATVHETQGGTFDEVAVVRLETFFDKAESEAAPAIFNRIPYVLVASTRAKYKLTYYTASLENDALVRAIESVTPEMIEKISQRKPSGDDGCEDLFQC